MNEASLRLRAALDDSTAMVELAQWLLDRRRPSEGQQWLLNAATAGDLTGMTHLGVLLAKAGDLPTAERWLTRAAEAGQAAAMVSLGMVRADFDAYWHGRRKGGLITFVLPASPASTRRDRDWLRRAAEAGDALGMFVWSVDCAQRGRTDDSARWRDAAADCRDPTALIAIGNYCQRHHTDDAMPWYERAAAVEDGDPFVRSNAVAQLAQQLPVDQAEARLRAATSIGANAWGVLAEWLEQHGRVAEAEECYRTAVEQGSYRAMNNLGALLLERAEFGEAERCLLPAAEDGFSESMNNLAVVRLRRGDRQDAACWLIRAVAAENTAAWRPLRQLLSSEGVELLSAASNGDVRDMAIAGTWLAAAGQTAEAEAWLRRAAAAGEPDGMDSLGFMLSQRPGGDIEGAAWLRKAVDGGSINACNNLALLRERQHRNAEAEELYERAAQAGHVRSMTSLAWSLEQRGEGSKAEHWYRQAVAHDDPRAMSNLGNLLEQRGEHDDAEHWFQRAARTGDADAMHNLAAMYGRRGDEQLALLWYVKAAKAGSAAAKEKITRRY